MERKMRKLLSFEKIFALYDMVYENQRNIEEIRKDRRGLSMPRNQTFMSEHDQDEAVDADLVSLQEHNELLQKYELLKAKVDETRQRLAVLENAVKE